MRVIIVDSIPFASQKEILERLFDEHTEYCVYPFGMLDWPKWNDYVFITHEMAEEFDELEIILKTHKNILRGSEIVDKYNIVLYDTGDVPQYILQQMSDPKFEMTSEEILEFWKKQTALYGPLDYFEYKFYETGKKDAVGHINNDTDISYIFGNADEGFAYNEFVSDRGIKITEQQWKPILRNDPQIVYRKKYTSEESAIIDKYKEELKEANDKYIENVQDKSQKEILLKIHDEYIEKTKEFDIMHKLLYDPISFHTAYRDLNYLNSINHSMPNHLFAYGFNLLLREELIVRSNATRMHRFVLTCEEMYNLYYTLAHLRITKRIRSTFPYSSISRINMHHEKYIQYNPIFDAEKAYTYIQKKYNNILSYFPEESGIIASVHGSNVLFSIANIYEKTDLDVRICSSDGTMVKQDKFKEYVEKLRDNLQEYTDTDFYLIEHSSSKYTFYFLNFEMDVYNSFWGSFNMYHVPMARADLQFLPTRKLCGTFTFFYSLLTNIALDIRYAPTETASLLDIIDKYAKRGFSTYCTNRIIEEIYFNEKNKEKRNDFFRHLGMTNIYYKNMGICRFNISNIARYVYGNNKRKWEIPESILRITNEIDMKRDHIIVHFSDESPMRIKENASDYDRLIDRSEKFYGIFYSKDDFYIYSTDYSNIISNRELHISNRPYHVNYKNRRYPIENGTDNIFAIKYDPSRGIYVNIDNYMEFLSIIKNL